MRKNVFLSLNFIIKFGFNRSGSRPILFFTRRPANSTKSSTTSEFSSTTTTSSKKELRGLKQKHFIRRINRNWMQSSWKSIKGVLEIFKRLNYLVQQRSLMIGLFCCILFSNTLLPSCVLYANRSAIPTFPFSGLQRMQQCP